MMTLMALIKEKYPPIFTYISTRGLWSKNTSYNIMAYWAVTLLSTRTSIRWWDTQH